MHTLHPRYSRPSRRLCRWLTLCFFALAGDFAASSIAIAQEAQQSREPGAQIRLPRQQAQSNAALDGVVRSGAAPGAQVPVAGATLTLQNLASNVKADYTSNGEGIFRIFPLAPGDYSLSVMADGYASFVLEKMTLHPNEVLTLEISLLAQPSSAAQSRLPRLPELGPPLPAEVAASSGSYREFRHRLDSDPNYVLNPLPESLPPAADVFATVPDRWALQQPEYRRYPSPGEYIYTKPRWYDPFNRNKSKGDEPIWPERFGQRIFFNLTATADTSFDARRVPSPSNVSAANPGSSTFFGRGEQEFVGAWNKDDATIHYDENGFLVRPAPIGNVISQNPGGGPIPHGIRVGYFGWLGSGHIRRVNLTHAFYQAVGEDTFNPIANRRVTVNAQLAAAEFSYDRDWIRYRVSTFYTSGDANPRDGRARGFDSILDLDSFAGGLFSFWNREGFRLTGSGVLLTTPGSLIPSMRASKDEGQANFVNPGILLVNAGADFDITPKLKGFANVNYLRFERTEPLEDILFQAAIRHSIGVDYGAGVTYRPPLSENIVLTGGAAMLTPGAGFRDIYGGKTLFSLFSSVKFTF